MQLAVASHLGDDVAAAHELALLARQLAEREREAPPRHRAERELREETGLRAGELTEIGFMYALNGIADAPEHVFLATGLEPVPGAHATDRHEEGIDEDSVPSVLQEIDETVVDEAVAEVILVRDELYDRVLTAKLTQALNQALRKLDPEC